MLQLVRVPQAVAVTIVAMAHVHVAPVVAAIIADNPSRPLAVYHSNNSSFY